MSIPGTLSGWKYYFPDNENSNDRQKFSSTIWHIYELVMNSEDVLLNDHVKNSILQEGKIELRFPVLKETLLQIAKNTQDRQMFEFASCLENFLFTNPVTLINVIGCAYFQAVFSGKFAFASQLDQKKLHVRISDYAIETKLKHLNSSKVGRFVKVIGNCIRVGAIKPLVRSMHFKCNICGAEKTQQFKEGRYTVPLCMECNKNARMNPDKDRITVVDWQKIKIQEIPKKGRDQIPRSMQVDLYDDLVDCCIPGDVIEVSGIVRAVRTDLGGRDKNRSVYVLYLEANNVEKAMASKSSSSEEGGGGHSFSKKDYLFIREVCTQLDRNGELFRTLVHSIAPHISGQNLVKAGLLLALMGGTKRTQHGMAIRSDIHVIMVGDPGMGKSQLLKSVINIAPRGVYVCGNSTTGGGLTATVSGADGGLEAGALVLSDQGVCCIDEFDKMKEKHGSLLEAMEQQSISIAKCGAVCTLASRTSVIAAGNPVNGHYDKSKSVAENLNIDPALISRFDIIFLLKDTQNKNRDKMLSEHIFSMHRKRTGNANTDNFSGYKELRRRPDMYKDFKSLHDRLALANGEKIDNIPASLLRKYIAYAREHVHPSLSPEAKKIIKDFYLSLRQKRQSVDDTPITTRQLCSMIRMCEARARAELREVVTDQDARDVVEITQESLVDMFEDEHGCMDFTRGKSGLSGMKAVNEIRRRLLNYGPPDRMIPKRDLNTIICNVDPRGRERMQDYIQKLNSLGIILMKGNNKFQIQC